MSGDKNTDEREITFPGPTKEEIILARMDNLEMAVVGILETLMADSNALSGKYVILSDIHARILNANYQLKQDWDRANGL